MERMLGTDLTPLGQGIIFRFFGKNVQQNNYIHMLLPDLLLSLS